MSYLFDYGEFLLCIGPFFIVIWAIGAALLWNSLPDRAVRKKVKDE